MENLKKSTVYGVISGIQIPDTYNQENEQYQEVTSLKGFVQLKASLKASNGKVIEVKFSLLASQLLGYGITKPSEVGTLNGKPITGLLMHVPANYVLMFKETEYISDKDYYRVDALTVDTEEERKRNLLESFILSGNATPEMVNEYFKKQTSNIIENSVTVVTDEKEEEIVEEF